MIEEYIGYCLNWGKYLSEDYASINFMLLILSLYGLINLLYLLYKFVFWRYQK